jgi:flagellar motor switch protein FliG
MKVTLESVMEKRLETVLRKVLATNDVFVVANVELLADADRPDVEVLPGVVVKKTPASAAPMELPASLVKRVTVSVFVSESISDANLDLARATAQRMVGIKPERGDVLNVEKVRTPPVVSPPHATFLDQALNPGYVLLAAWLLAACWGLVLILRRFLDPLLGVMREAAQTSAKAGTQAAPQNPQELERETAIGAALEVPGAANSAGPDERKLPFSFIKERDLPALELLLLDQSDVTAAIIVQYLPPVLGARALSGMEASRREMVLAYMSKPAMINQVEVKKIEDAITAKIDYVMGGEEKLVSILDQASIAMQTEMLEMVRRRDPELGQRLNQRIVLIEDIGLLDEAGLTALSRHATVRGMAVVLKSLPHLRKDVMSKLKTGFGEWLEQETALIGELPEQVKEAEMRVVLQALVRLVRSGKIILRKAAPPPTPSVESGFPTQSAPEAAPDRVQ